MIYDHQYMATRQQQLLTDDYNEQQVQPPAAVVYPSATGMRQTARLIEHFTSVSNLLARMLSSVNQSINRLLICK